MINLMYAIGIIFEVLVSVSFFDKMLTRKSNRGYVVIVWALGSILSDILAGNIPIIIRLIISLSLSVTVMFILYNGSVMRKLIIAAFMNISCSIAELIANLLLIVVIGYSEDREFFILGYVLTKVMYFIFTRIVILVSKNKNDTGTEYKSFLSILIVPAVSMVLLVSIYIMKPVKVFETYDIIIYSSIMIINYITVIQYDNLQKMMELDNKNKLLKNQSAYYVQLNMETQKLWSSIIDIRHNIKNEYAINKTMLEEQKYDELLKRYDSLISEITLSKNISNSGNPYIDAIINYKASEIKSIGGKIYCRVFIPADININKDDMVLILGNILDNIKDAFMEEKLTDKSCELIVIYDEPNFIISAENIYYGKRKKSAAGEYITTKDNKDIHGIGLRAVKKTLEKYKGDIKITDENNVFNVRIIIQL